MIGVISNISTKACYEKAVYGHIKKINLIHWLLYILNAISH